MSYRVHLKTKVIFNNDVVIDTPRYMSKEEVQAHIEDAHNALNGDYNFEQFVNKLEEMGFDIIELVSDFTTKKDSANSEIVHVFKVEDEAY